MIDKLYIYIIYAEQIDTDIANSVCSVAKVTCSSCCIHIDAQWWPGNYTIFCIWHMLVNIWVMHRIVNGMVMVLLVNPWVYV